MDSKVVVVVILLSSFVLIQGKAGYVLRQPGNFIIGQLLSLHKTDYVSSKCGNLDVAKIIQVEALVYSAKQINTENPNLRLGYDVIEVCHAVSVSEMHARLDFATSTWFERKDGNISRVPVAIITDLDEENDYLSVATKVRKFTQRTKNSGISLPLISVKTRPRIWPNTYFLSPQQNTPHRAILELVKYFQWNILDVIVQGNNHEFHDFKKMTEDNNICLLNELFVSKTNTVKDTRWLRKGKSNASVVVVFASQLSRLMAELDSYTSRSRNFILGSELAGTQVRWEGNLEGVLGIQRDFGDLTDFEKHLASSKLLKTWVNKTICLNVSWENCDVADRMKEVIMTSSWQGSAIIDAVYAIVQARSESGAAGGGRLPKTGLAGIETTSSTGRVVSFDKKEKLDQVTYKVLNFQKPTSHAAVKAVKIGEIKVSTGKAELSVNSKARGVQWRSSKRPRSRCSTDCPPGTSRKPLHESSANCCWDCIPCELGKVSSFHNSSRCSNCPPGSKPTADRTKCQPPYFDYLRWYEPFSLIMIFLLAFTIFFLVYAVKLYVKKANTPVFVGSKCASLPFLLSLFVTFFLPILLLMKPTRSSCGAYNAIFVFALGAPLTFLIARSHIVHNYCYTEVGQLKRKLFCFNPQTAISFILVTLLLIFVVIQLNVSPVTVLSFDTAELDVEYIECSSHSKSEFLPLAFLIFLLVMSFNILHMNEISSPANLNEVKFVSLAMFFLYSILFVYFIAVFGINGKKKIMIICAMSYLIGLNYFAAIFLPKIYLILFRPEENLRDESPLLRDDDENGKPVRMIELGHTDSPLPGLRSRQYERTEV